MEVFRRVAAILTGERIWCAGRWPKRKKQRWKRKRNRFIYGEVKEDGTIECPGAVRNGVDADTANRLFDEMASFAILRLQQIPCRAYSIVSYQTAYLKYHYPQRIFGGAFDLGFGSYIPS